MEPTSSNLTTTTQTYQPPSSSRVGRAPSIVQDLEEETNAVSLKVIKKAVQFSQENNNTKNPRRSKSLDEDDFLTKVGGGLSDSLPLNESESTVKKTIKRTNSTHKKHATVVSTENTTVEKKNKISTGRTITAVFIRPAKNLSDDQAKILKKQNWNLKTPPSDFSKFKSTFLDLLTIETKEHSKWDAKKILNNVLKNIIDHTAIPKRLEEASGGTDVTEIKEFIDQFKKLKNPSSFLRKLRQIKEDQHPIINAIIGDAEILEFLSHENEGNYLSHIEYIKLIGMTQENLNAIKWNFSTPAPTFSETKEKFFSYMADFAKKYSNLETLKILNKFHHEKAHNILEQTPAIYTRLDEAITQSPPEAKPFFISFREINDLKHFLEKRDGLPPRLRTTFDFIVGEGDLKFLEYVCHKQKDGEWANHIKEALFNEELSKLKNLATQATQKDAWEKDFELKLYQITCENLQKDSESIVSMVIQKSFESTTIVARVQEAHQKFAKEFPFLDKFLKLTKAEEYVQQLLNKELTEDKLKLIKTAIGCSEILVVMHESRLLWKKKIEEIKKSEKTARSSQLDELHKKEIQRFNNLNNEPITEQEWNKDLYFKLIEEILKNPKESPERIVSIALIRSFQSLPIMARIKEAQQKNGILAHFLTPFLECQTHIEFTSKFLDASKNDLTPREQEIFLNVIGNWEILEKLCSQDHSRCIQYVKQTQAQLNQFLSEKNKNLILNELGIKLCSKSPKKPYENKVELTPQKIADIKESFRAFYPISAQEDIPRCIEVNGKPLQIKYEKEKNTEEAFLEALFFQILSCLNKETKNSLNYVTIFLDTAKQSSGTEIGQIKEIPLLNLLLSASFNSYVDAEISIRNVLYPFYQQQDLKIRHLNTTESRFKIAVDGETNTYSVTHIKLYTIHTGFTNAHKDYASFEVNWTISGSIDVENPNRNALLKFKNFKLLTDDEEILKQMFIFLTFSLQLAAN